MGKPAKVIVDEQTGTPFELKQEEAVDVVFAWISATYSLAVIAYLAYVLLDTWSGQYKVWPGSLTSQLDKTVSANVFRLIVYTAIGGGMGAAVNNIRAFVSWHAERKAFGWRFIWKYIALPPLGATLAVLVYGILQGGMAVFNGGNVGGNGAAVTSLSAWATGTLAGYGSHKVFIWLDDKVNSFFKVDAKTTTKVPDLDGKTADEAKRALHDAKLNLGQTTEQVVTDSTLAGKVVAQEPAAGAEIACNSDVNIGLGVSSDKGATKPDEIKKNGQPATPPEPEVVAAGTGVVNTPDANNSPTGGDKT
jgi:PASTA domain-containing protein